ncbi:helix-turn-helix transcriptional regulator [Rhodovarius crocodyli]|nr:helix-turn-helix transcriptional regulator [Rhodovarius crocodyli]
MDDYQRRIREQVQELLARTGMDATGLARAAGLAPSTLTRFLNDPDVKHSLSGKTMQKLIDAASAGGAPAIPTPPGKSEVRPAPDAPVPVLAEMKRDVPVFGTARGANGDGAFVLDMSEVVDWVRRPPGLIGVRDVYALWVEGDSMEPAISHGDLVYLHPKRPIHPGDRVVIVRREGLEDQHVTMRAYVKQFVRRAGGKVITRQFNPDKEVEFAQDEVVSMHKVLSMADMMGV